MSTQDSVAADPRGAVFAVLSNAHAGMLGLTAGGDGARPMTHFAEEDTNLIWFISSAKTALVQSLDMGEDAEYIVISKGHDIHVRLRGKLFHVSDDAKLDELWTPQIAAWFGGGRDDPTIAMLRFEPDIAEIWASSPTAVRIGVEVANANLATAEAPTIGVKATVKLRSAM
jgi:general stress protein 26